MTGNSVDILQITDLHIHDDPAVRTRDRDTLATLASVLRAIVANDHDPDLILATGDLTDTAKPAAYRRLKPLLAGLPVPVYVIPGNHDLVPQMCEHLVGGPIRHAASATAGAWSLVFLDSTVPHEVHGHLDAARLDALDREIERAETPHVMVVMHHQPAPIGSPLDDCGLMNADDLYGVLDRHDKVKALLWGHIHHEHDSERRGVRRLGTPSTCFQFSTDMHAELACTDQPPAYRRLRLHDDGRVETEVVWVG
jgi:3',5'-cyclic-AMP phosphodiesterase